MKRCTHFVNTKATRLAAYQLKKNKSAVQLNPCELAIHNITIKTYLGRHGPALYLLCSRRNELREVLAASPFVLAVLLDFYYFLAVPSFQTTSSLARSAKKHPGAAWALYFFGLSWRRRTDAQYILISTFRPRKRARKACTTVV